MHLQLQLIEFFLSTSTVIYVLKINPNYQSINCKWYWCKMFLTFTDRKVFNPSKKKHTQNCPYWGMKIEKRKNFAVHLLSLTDNNPTWVIKWIALLFPLPPLSFENVVIPLSYNSCQVSNFYFHTACYKYTLTYMVLSVYGNWWLYSFFLSLFYSLYYLSIDFFFLQNRNISTIIIPSLCYFPRPLLRSFPLSSHKFFSCNKTRYPLKGENRKGHEERGFF